MSRNSREAFEPPPTHSSNAEPGADFFDFDNQPNALPIYASGRAFVASSFDPLLIQCFYTIVAASLFETLVIGQKYQAAYQVYLPAHLNGKTFKDVYRSFIARNTLVLGLYRAPTKENEASFDYVYTSPDMDTICNEHDRLYLFTNPKRLGHTLDEFVHLSQNSQNASQGSRPAAPEPSTSKSRSWF